MYVPRAFAVDDIKILHQQMQACPLPVLVTHTRQGLLASHVPLLLARTKARTARCTGTLPAPIRTARHWRKAPRAW